MTRREYIQRLRAEMRERQGALKAEIAALEEVKRARLREVASTLSVVPPMLKEYLAQPAASFTPQAERGSRGEAAKAAATPG